MSSVYATQAFQQSRHARRIYIGGFPPNYGDEEALKFFLNSVIAKGLGEPNDNSYVLSIYVNQKKCFAFVELRAIELATACLDLDGIIYKKVVLKVLRANEYKPELIPPSMVGSPITLDLSSFSFGTPAPINNNMNMNNNEKANTSSPISFPPHINTSKEAVASDDQRLDSVIQFASLSYLTPGTLTIVGYPFDDRGTLSYSQNNNMKENNCHITTPTSTTGAGSGGSSGLGCTQAAKKMRNMIRKYKFGLLQNPEYNIDLSPLRFVDIGDVPVGKTREETKHNLSSIITEVVHKHSIPFIVGGSSECSYYTIQGVLSTLYDNHAQSYENQQNLPEVGMATGSSRVGMVVVSAQIEDLRILDDARFLTTKPHTTIATAVTAAASTATTTASGSGSYSSASSINDSDYQQFLQLQSTAEGNSTDTATTTSTSTTASTATCEGRYVRFAAQGSQCTVSQANQVTQRGGHMVWLGRDIRNQSPQCSVLPTGEDHSSYSASSHAYTLKLFRDSLRCAAGVISHIVPAPVAPPVSAAAVGAGAVSPIIPVITTPATGKTAKTNEFVHVDNADTSTDCPAATSTTTAEPTEHSSALPSAGTGIRDHSPTPTAANSEVSTLTLSAESSQVSSMDHVSAATSKEAISTTAATTPPASPGKVIVSFDMGALSGAVKGCGYVTGSSCSATGLTIEEILDMAMIAGADPNVISLDISEFSPDAEDTRVSMFLAQLFYSFSMGVAKRAPSSTMPTTICNTSSTTGASTAIKQPMQQFHHSIEVENASGSFVFPQHTSILPTLSNKQQSIDNNSSNSSLKSVDTALISSSRTPRFYHEVGSGSMDLLATGGSVCGNSASTVGWDAGGGSGYRPQTSSSMVAHQPYVEVDHRMSSMDAMDLQSSTNMRRTPPPHTLAPSHGDNALGGARTQYPSGAFTARTATVALNAEPQGMVRVSPGSTPRIGSMPVRTMSASTANSPPLPIRNMSNTTTNAKNLSMNGSIYSGAEFGRSVVQNPQFHPQQQQQQMQYPTQQQGYSSAQQHHAGAVGVRPSQSYRRDVAPMHGQHLPQQQQSQYGGYHQYQQHTAYQRHQQTSQQYQQQAGPCSTNSYPYHDRSQVEHAGRYTNVSNSSALHFQEQGSIPTRNLRHSQQQQRSDVYRNFVPSSEDHPGVASSQLDFLGSEFLDIPPSERFPEQGGFIAGTYGRTGGSIPTSASANALHSRSTLGLAMNDNASVGSAGSLCDLQSTDDALHLLDYGLTRTDVPGQPQQLSSSPLRRGMHAPPSSLVHQHQGRADNHSSDLYGEMMCGASSGSSGDSLVYSQANCRSLSSDMMGSLPGGFELPSLTPLHITTTGTGGYNGNGFYSSTGAALPSQQQHGQGICLASSPVSTSSLASHSSRLQHSQ